MTKCVHHPDKPHRGRGLCETCYQYAWQKIKAGTWTWAQLEAQGHALPQCKRGPKGPAWAAQVTE